MHKASLTTCDFSFQIDKPKSFDQTTVANFTAVRDKPNEPTTSDNSSEVPTNNASVQVMPMPMLRQHHKISDWKLKCNKCDRHFVTETLLEKHISLKHPESNPGVTVGMLSGSSNSNRKEGTSSQVPSVNKKLRCPICDREFINEPLLNQHVLRTHLHPRHEGPCPSEESVLNTCAIRKEGTSSQVPPTNKKLRCPICDREFITEPLLHQHVSRTHLHPIPVGPWPSEESVLNTCAIFKNKARRFQPNRAEMF